MPPESLPKLTRTYVDHPFLDSTHWYGFVPRPGDIVIASPLRSGTTWLQTIVANLIWQDGQLPKPVHYLSPWLDARAMTHTTTLDRLEHQFHRRFIKSHLPLDAMPYFSEVTYLVLGRDPRDQFMSLWDRQHTHTGQDAANPWRPDAIGHDVSLPTYETTRAFWSDWISRGWFPWESEGYPYWSSFYHAQSWWAFRHLPNISFVHYGDLLKDPRSEIRRIANVLGIAIDEGKFDGICERTSFRHMRENFGDINPSMMEKWQGVAQSMINKGTNGRWRDVLTPDDLTLYDAAVARCDMPECARWLETGGPVTR